MEGTNVVTPKNPFKSIQKLIERTSNIFRMVQLTWKTLFKTPS